MKLLLTLLIVLTISYITSNMAAKRGRDRTGWFILGFFFGIFALLTVLILPPLNAKKEEEPRVKSSDLVPTYPEEPVDTFAEHQWHFIDVNGKQKGPVDIVDLQVAWDDGVANRDCFVWHEGMEEWKTISEVIGLQKRLSGDPVQHTS